MQSTHATAMQIDDEMISIDAGNNHTCAVTGDGEVYCWGWNADGQVGDDTTTQVNSPALVFSGANNIFGGGARYGSFCATKTDGTTWCWGRNSTGQLGDGTTIDTHNC